MTATNDRATVLWRAALIPVIWWTMGWLAVASVERREARRLDCGLPEAMRFERLTACSRSWPATDDIQTTLKERDAQRANSSRATGIALAPLPLVGLVIMIRRHRRAMRRHRA